MSRRFPIYLVDVFAEQPFTGNPLAAIGCPSPLRERRMQQIADEIRVGGSVIATVSGELQPRIAECVGDQ